MGAEVGVEVGVSSLRYFITAEDLKSLTGFPLYHVIQADYLEGYIPKKGICKARDWMYSEFISKLRPFCRVKWKPEEIDEVNEDIYSIVEALEKKFPYLFKEKKKYGMGWYERKMVRKLLDEA